MGCNISVRTAVVGLRGLIFFDPSSWRSSQMRQGDTPTAQESLFVVSTRLPSYCAQFLADVLWPYIYEGARAGWISLHIPLTLSALNPPYNVPHHFLWLEAIRAAWVDFFYPLNFLLRSIHAQQRLTSLNAIHLSHLDLRQHIGIRSDLSIKPE